MRSDTESWTRAAGLLARIDIPAPPASPQSAWEKSIAGYLYLGGLGAGAFTVAVVGKWLSVGIARAELPLVNGWEVDPATAFLLWGPFVTAAGAALLLVHLGRNRVLAYTAGRNPGSSWLARGFLILSGFIAVGCALALVAVFLPAWVDRPPVVWRAVEGLAVALALTTAVYTGLLLRSMKFIPAWSSSLVPPLFLASALSTGAMGIVLSLLAYRLLVPDAAPVEGFVRAVERVEPAFVLSEAVFLAIYVSSLARGSKPEGVLSARMLLSGSWRYGFWLGVVGLALVVPLVSYAAGVAMRSDHLMVAAAASVLVGGFLLRVAILSVGIKEEPPLYKYSQWRAQAAGSPSGDRREPPGASRAPVVS